MAAILDQYGVHGQTTAHPEVSLSGTYTGGTWYDVGINRPEIAEGIYILRFYVDTFNAGVGSQYMNYTVSEPFFWHTSVGSNSNSRSSITMSSLFYGHAPNSYLNPNSMFEMGILHKFSGVAHELQIKFVNTGTLTGASGSQFRINLYRIG